MRYISIEKAKPGMILGKEELIDFKKWGGKKRKLKELSLFII